MGQTGLHEEAIVFLNKTIGLNPNSPEAHYDLARDDIALDNSSAARRELEKAVLMKPRFYKAELLLGTLLVDEGNGEAAIPHLREAVRARAHYQLGIVYRELGDNRSATVNLDAAIRGAFDNLGAKLNLIEAAFSCRQLTLAFETAKQVISPTVKSPDVSLRVGRLLFDHLFYKQALRAGQFLSGHRPHSAAAPAACAAESQDACLHRQ